MTQLDARVAAHGQEWPKLSETLPGPKDAFHCQSCGRSKSEILSSETTEKFTIWQECDRTDTPTKVFVSLCSTCNMRSNQHGVRFEEEADEGLIERHPRLYERLENHYPWAGALHLCKHCTFRQSWDCTHPKLTRNGGSGLMVMAPAPRPFHVSFGGGKGRFYGGYGMPSSCEGQNLELKP